jgi:hypothetical protein
MVSLISTGARIASERTEGWTRQLRITPLPARAYLRAKLATGCRDRRLDARARRPRVGRDPA